VLSALVGWWLLPVTKDHDARVDDITAAWGYTHLLD